MDSSIEFTPGQHRIRGHDRSRPVGDDRARLRRRHARDDVRDQPKPRGHPARHDPGNAARRPAQPGARLRHRRGLHGPLVQRRGGRASTPTSSSSRERSATRRSTATGTGPGWARTRSTGSRSRSTNGSTGSPRAPPPCSRSAPARRTAGFRRCETTRPARWGYPTTWAGTGARGSGLPIVCIPGCPALPDNMTEMLLQVIFHVVGHGPAPELDELLRPVSMFGETTREGCTRAGFTEQGQFATEYGADRRCLVKLGCKGPVVKCNVARRGWMNGIGGCPNVGGLCMACTMPSFPDAYMPFMDPDPWGNTAADVQRFTYGPIFRYFRKRNLKQKYEAEPEWRRPGPRLLSGYAPGGSAASPADRTSGELTDGHARRDPALARLQVQQPLLPHRQGADAPGPAAARLRAQVQGAARGGAGRDGDRQLARSHRAGQRPGGAAVRLPAARDHRTQRRRADPGALQGGASPAPEGISPRRAAAADGLGSGAVRAPQGRQRVPGRDQPQPARLGGGPARLGGDPRHHRAQARRGEAPPPRRPRRPHRAPQPAQLRGAPRARGRDGDSGPASRG